MKEREGNERRIVGITLSLFSLYVHYFNQFYNLQ